MQIVFPLPSLLLPKFSPNDKALSTTPLTKFFERGFIRAEIVDYKILLELGSYTIAKEKGKVRSEGKDYVVQDGPQNQAF